MGPEQGWRSPITLGCGTAAAVFLLAFLYVERTADNPVMPFDLFRDRNRVATFAAVFMAGGVMFTLTVLIGLYVQDIMGYSALRAGSVSSRSSSRSVSASACRRTWCRCFRRGCL